MKPVEDAKAGTSKAAATGSTTGDDSGATPDATTPTTVRPSTATSSTSESASSTAPTDPSTTTDAVTAATHPPGISMVQGPLITGLDVLLPESSSPTATADSAANSHPNTPTTVSSVRFSEHVEWSSSIHRQELDKVTDYNRGLSTSPNPREYFLDDEVNRYIKRRDSAFYDYYPGTESDTYDYIAERNDYYTTNCSGKTDHDSTYQWWHPRRRDPLRSAPYLQYYSNCGVGHVFMDGTIDSYLPTILGIVESTAHMIKGSLGAAVLSMHEAYMFGGLWTSLAVTVLVGVLIGYTMIMLITSAQKMYRRIRIHKLSYPDLAETAAATAPWRWVRKKSKAFRYTVEICLFLYMCGGCCIYQIVIAQSIMQIINRLESDITAWLSDIRMYILITTPMLIPLCLIRSIKVLAPFALIADIFVAICVFSTLYYSLLAFNSHIMDRAAWKDLHGFIRVWGICMYGTSGTCIALPVENNMRSPRHFPYVVKYATVIVVFLTATTGFFGYWAWGEDCRSPITVHMPTNTSTTILHFLLVMMLSTTFAVNFWVLFRIVWHYFMRKYKRNLPCWERTYRLLLAVLIMVAALVATHTIPVMIFLGQFLLGFIALIFPAFIEFVVNWEEHYASRTRVRFAHNLKNFGLIFLGLILSVSTFYSVRDRH